MVVRSYRPKPSPPKGCASVIALVLICLLAACTSLTSSPDSLGINTNQLKRISGEANSKHYKEQYAHIDDVNESLCIVVWIDKSYSVKESVPKVEKEQILNLLDLIDNIGTGSLALGIIGRNTKSDMIFYNRSNKSLKPPVREHGMSSKEYQKKLLSYKKKRDRGGGSVSNESKRVRFEKALVKYLDYSSLHSRSKVCEAINISKQIFKQANNIDANKVLLTVTDGLDNGDEKCSWNLGKGIEMIVVNRLSYDAFPLYTNEHYIDIEIAIDQIINKY